MNIVDLIGIGFLIGWAVWGYRRGFIYTFVDLLGFLFCLAVALRFYPGIGDYLVSGLGANKALSNLVAFLGVFTVVHTAFMTIFVRLYRPLPMWLFVHHWKKPERVLGVIPGIVGGVCWLALILGFVTWFPISPSAKAAIDDSAIGKPLADQATVIEPQIERLVGPVARDTIGFITVRKHDERTPIKIPKSTTLSVDEHAERKMLEKVNEVRMGAGLDPLEMDPSIRKVAREHSEEMFRLGYFAHDSPISGSPFDRMSKAGIDYFIAGENIAYAQNVDLAHDGLMNSKSHRDNILTPDYRRVGIGVVDAGVYGEMFTQDFTD